MYEYGTTPEQLAWIKVAASHHAQHNPNAMLREVVTVEDVLNSPMISDPLHKLDCCVVSDGGGALIVARPEIAAKLKRPKVKILGAGEHVKGQLGGQVDLSWSAARLRRGRVRRSRHHARRHQVRVDLRQLHHHRADAAGRPGLLQEGRRRPFVADGNLISGVGKLPFNTDGGGLCNNHPANRGGITKVIEAVRQLRGEAHPAVQVKNCDLALAQGTGGYMGSRHGSATLILERE
jgi:acetyl-CoA C-acetyltransferase